MEIPNTTWILESITLLQFYYEICNLHDNHEMQIITVVLTVAVIIILFEVLPEKSVWSFSVRQTDTNNPGN